MPLDDSDRDYLLDILATADDVQSFLAGHDADVLQTSRLHLRAIERCFEIVGEAANHLFEAFGKQHPELPLGLMVGLRNILAHDYETVRQEILWETATEDLPALRLRILEILTEEA